MNTQPADTTGVVVSWLESPVEPVENTQAGVRLAAADGPRACSSGCVRVFATSWPYIGHSPPALVVAHGAAAPTAGPAQTHRTVNSRPTNRPRRWDLKVRPPMQGQ